VDASIARRIAHDSHAGQRTDRGVPRIAHVERVAAAVADDARALAFLHDVLDHTNAHGDELLANGLTSIESAALALLSRAPGESYKLHVLRIVHARGPEGRLARMVKLAELEDHLLEGGYEPGDPPYAWARQQILAGRSRRGEGPPAEERAVRGERTPVSPDAGTVAGGADAA
jgi:hypothetical protein